MARSADGHRPLCHVGAPLRGVPPPRRGPRVPVCYLGYEGRWNGLVQSSVISLNLSTLKSYEMEQSSQSPATAHARVYVYVLLAGGFGGGVVASGCRSRRRVGGGLGFSRPRPSDTRPLLGHPMGNGAQNFADRFAVVVPHQSQDSNHWVDWEDGSGGNLFVPRTNHRCLRLSCALGLLSLGVFPLLSGYFF